MTPLNFVHDNPEDRGHEGRHRQLHEAALLARTVVRLRPAQVAHRIRLRTLRTAERHWPELVIRPLALPAGVTPGWPESFSPLDAPLDHGDATEIAQGTFTFLGETRSLGEPADWHQEDVPRLWRFHLHYLEWAWALAQATDRASARASFADLWRSWGASTAPAQGDAWSPYVASLRAWVLCGVFDSLAKGSEIESDYLDQIAWHAGYVQSHLELDVGGNHLLKNLKALIGTGVFLDRPDVVASGQQLLEAQLPVQVLADGGHFERSPSYHCQVLGDLLDIRGLLAGVNAPPVAGLEEVIDSMRRWLGAMVGADGEVALFKDAIPVGEQRLVALDPTPLPEELVTVLAASGYVVVRPDNRTQLILDVGDPCPDDLPAHAHADCLSFELWVDGERWVVDTGTSTYEAGPRRAHERSTAAHNTVEVDRVDQTEVWGIFRAARQAHGSLESITIHGNTVEVVASHDGYRRLTGSPVHRRRWRISPGEVEITDTVSGTSIHRVLSRLHVAPNAAERYSISGRGGNASIETHSTAWGFGQLRPVTVHLLEAGKTELPATLGWLLKWTTAPSSTDNSAELIVGSGRKCGDS